MIDNQKIRSRLKKETQLEDEQISEIIDVFWFADAYNSLISQEFFLSQLITYLQRNPLPKGQCFVRLPFYDYLITRETDQATISKLEKIALFMESLQVNEISQKKFGQILRKLDTSLDISTLPNLLITFRKDSETMIRFAHHSLQEYLASQTINDTATLERFALFSPNMIKPSWYSVIRFLLEKDLSTYTNWLLILGQRNKENIDESYTTILTSVARLNFPRNLAIKVFNLVYKHYQARVVWFPLWSRSNLGRLVQKEHLATLKKDARIRKGEKIDDPRRFVRLGNVASIVSRALKDQPRVFAPTKETWKKTFVSFALDKNKNGVLQRSALSALSFYHDPALVKKLASNCYKNTDDRLVKEAFLQFCWETDPNHHDTIHYLTQAIKDGLTVYGRTGLYQISKPRGITILLKKLVNNLPLLEKFLSQDSIFRDEKSHQDRLITQQIQLTSQNLDFLQAIIFNLLRLPELYDSGKYFFVKKACQALKKKKPKFIFDLIDQIAKENNLKKRWRLFWQTEGIFGLLLTVHNLKEFAGRLIPLHEHAIRIIEGAVYKSKNTKILKKAKDLKLVTITITAPTREDYWKNRDEETINEFIRLLGNEKEKRYFPAVFQYFNQNEELFVKHFSSDSKEIKRLKKLVIQEGLVKIDPTKITVRISPDNPQQYTISSVAQYYGAFLHTAQIIRLDRDLRKHRQSIINFYPYAFSDIRGIVEEFLSSLSSEELKKLDLGFIKKVYSGQLDNKTGTRYLLPNNCIYLFEFLRKRDIHPSFAASVLNSLIGNTRIPLSTQRLALKELCYHASKKSLEKLCLSLDKKKEGQNSEEALLGQLANFFLITRLKNEKAIVWRLRKIKEKAKKLESFRHPPGVHSIGPMEEEFDTLSFASPILKLKSQKYIPLVLDLLEFSKKLKDNGRNYLWRVVLGFFENLSLKYRSLKKLVLLENWLDQNKKTTGFNWLQAKLDQRKIKLVHNFSRPTTQVIKKLPITQESQQDIAAPKIASPGGRKKELKKQSLKRLLKKKKKLKVLLAEARKEPDRYGKGSKFEELVKDLFKMIGNKIEEIKFTPRDKQIDYLVYDKGLFSLSVLKPIVYIECKNPKPQEKIGAPVCYKIAGQWFLNGGAAGNPPFNLVIVITSGEFYETAKDVAMRMNDFCEGFIPIDGKKLDLFLNDPMQTLEGWLNCLWHNHKRGGHR